MQYSFKKSKSRICVGRAHRFISLYGVLAVVSLTVGIKQNRVFLHKQDLANKGQFFIRLIRAAAKITTRPLTNASSHAYTATLSRIFMISLLTPTLTLTAPSLTLRDTSETLSSDDVTVFLSWLCCFRSIFLISGDQLPVSNKQRGGLINTFWLWHIKWAAAVISFIWSQWLLMYTFLRLCELYKLGQSSVSVCLLAAIHDCDLELVHPPCSSD